LQIAEKNAVEISRLNREITDKSLEIA